MTDEPDHAAANDVRDRQRQIAADLRRQILTGEFTPGDKLPSTAQLCERYGVSNLTTQRALAILKKQGFVRGESGVGVFVTANQPIVVEANHYPGQTSSATPYPWISEIASHGRRKTSHLLSVDEVTPPVAVAAAYDIEPDTRVIRRRLLLLLDDVPAELVTNYYRTDLAHGTPLTEHRLISGGSLRVLAELGKHAGPAVDDVEATMPTIDEFIVLQMPDDMPVLRQFRIIYTTDGEPIEVTEMIKAAHRHKARYLLPGPQEG
ncbi:GntR family transcriptional regulator [Micromonospora sp. LOL_021]|uniref:GntR family transcriptional regulator n=1 Tax=Micromonospora sp. LOL_021 TaxID=3345417 RepID=UPI003A8538A6